MSKKSAGGRPAIYGPKSAKVQVRTITKDGRKILDRARKVAKRRNDWPGVVSDADAIEMVLREWKRLEDERG